jgi:hypothetical protein
LEDKVTTPTLLAKVKFQVEGNKLSKDMQLASEKAIKEATSVTEKGIINSLRAQIRNLDKIIDESSSFGAMRQAMEAKQGLQQKLSVAERGGEEETGIINTLRTQIRDLDKVIDSSSSFEEIRKAIEEKQGLQKELSLAERGGIGEKSDSKLPQLMSKSMGMILSPLKSIGSAMGQIIAGVSIGAAFMIAAKPVFTLVEAGVKMIGEFLRPITEVMMMLVQPLLIMIRPLVTQFRLLMLPFREMASRGMAAATTLIAQGMEMGGEEGAALKSEGIKGAINSASLLMSGFMEVILAPFYGIETLGIGEAIEGAVKSWQEKALEGVTRVVVLSDTFSGLTNILTDSSDAAKKALLLIDTQMSLLKGVVDKWNIDNAKEILNAAKSAADGAINSIGASLAGDEKSLKKYLEDAKDPAKDLGLSVEGMTGIFSNAVGLLDKMVEKYNSLGDTTAAAVVQVGGSLQTLTDLKNESEDAKNWGFFDKTKAFFEGVGESLKDVPLWQMVVPGLGGYRLGEALGSGVGNVKEEGNRRDELVSWNKEKAKSILDPLMEGGMKSLIDSQDAGLGKMLDSMKLYFGGSLVPDSFNTGLNNMLLSSTNSFDPEKGTITTSFNTGLNVMTIATQEFVSGMNKVADDIKAIASAAASYAASARSSANSAAESSRKASASRGWLG